MGIKKLLLLLVTVLLHGTLIAQSKKIEHIVVKGNTVFALAKTYGSSVEAIFTANPDIAQRDLIIGEALIIPILESPSVDSSRYIFHTVRSFESIYSISLKYAIKDSTVYWHNPSLGGEPLVRRGQILHIPKDADSWKPFKEQIDTFVPPTQHKYLLYKVKNGDTPKLLAVEWGLKSIEDFYQYNPEAREEWWVGMPIIRPVVGGSQTMLDSNATANKYRIDTLRIAAVLPVLSHDYINESTYAERSKIALSFYQGMQMAVKEFTDSGYAIQLNLFDTQNNPDSARIVFQKLQTGYELYVGPLYSSRMIEASRNLRVNRLVNPLSRNPALVDLGIWNTQVSPEAVWNTAASIMAAELNPQERTATDSVKTGLDTTEELSTSSSPKELILFGLADANFNKVYRTFVKELGMDKIHSVTSSEKWENNGKLTHLDTTKHYAIISVSADPAFVLDMLRNARQSHLKYTWYATPDQVNAKGMVTSTFEGERVTALFTGYTDYNCEGTLSFVRNFRVEFEREPDQYAFAGYDNVSFHLRRIIHNITQWRGIHQGFSFEGTQRENQFLELRTFKDLRWVKQEMDSQMSVPEVLDSVPAVQDSVRTLEAATQAPE